MPQAVLECVAFFLYLRQKCEILQAVCVQHLGLSTSVPQILLDVYARKSIRAISLFEFLVVLQRCPERYIHHSCIYGYAL